ncbi:MAG TPA: hypothetical protein VN736_30125 [Candidatus Limnocylindrales bacterium]|nr:hypothetical protein [Candidatus Limnocylindrales bacterium]
MEQRHEVSRREFLAFASIGGLFGDFWHLMPWYHAKEMPFLGSKFQIVRSKKPKHTKFRHYLLIHGDEHTAREVLTAWMESHRGIAYLVENQTREVPVEGGKVDPNRIYSDAGAEANLSRQNPAMTSGQIKAAMEEIGREREKVLNAILPSNRELLLALHNNDSEYSVLREAPISDQVAINKPEDPHAFFLCTDPADFQVLASSPYNVVLQAHVRAPDDGSLSRRAAQRNVRYVNLEVKMGQAEKQREMLAWAEGNLA